MSSWLRGPGGGVLLAVLVLAVAVGGGLGLCRLVGFGPREIKVVKVIEADGPVYRLEDDGGFQVQVDRNDHAGLSSDRCTRGKPPWGPRFDFDEVAWSSDGTAVYLSDGGRIYGVTSDGWRLWQVASARPPSAGTVWTSFSVAPDGIHLVYVACPRSSTGTGLSYDLFRVTRDGASVSRLTDNSFVEFYPAWSPDGQRIAFLSDAAQSDLESPTGPWTLSLYTMAADGTDVQLVLDYEFAMLHQPPQWSPDGRYLAVVRYLYKEVRTGFAVDFQEIGRELYVVGADGAKRWRVASKCG